MQKKDNSWDPVWEEIFKEKEWGKYPEIPIVRFVARNYYSSKDRSKIRILDLGCGPGAHSWYLAREGFDVYGIDGSKTAIENLKKRIKEENLKGSFIVGDIIKMPYQNEFFDCVIDSAAIQHNNIEEINKIIKEVSRILKKNGKFFSMMICEDRRIESGYGKVHFFNEEELNEIFKGFNDLKIDYLNYTENNRREHHKTWIIYAIKY